MPLLSRNITEWKQTDHLIDKWTEERQEMIVLYYKLSKTQPFKEEILETQEIVADPTELNRFCQILVDYVSVGHFEIFEKISEATTQKNSHWQRAKTLVKSLVNTTKAPMDFSDKYANTSHLTRCENTFKHDLSKLGEELAKRMDLEDNLIKIYLSATKE